MKKLILLFASMLPLAASSPVPLTIDNASGHVVTSQSGLVGNASQALFLDASGLTPIVNLPVIPVAKGGTGLTALGAGVQTALGNAINAASGIVTVNTSGNAAPNVSTTKSTFIIAGFGGAFESGRERAFLSASTDGLLWNRIRGLNNYSPPVTGDGIRDVDITKIGSTYFLSYTVSKSGGVEGYIGIASSPDLVNWTWVASPSGITASPKWFQDTNGNIYVVGYGSIMQNTSGDGVTWGSPVAFTLAGGGNVPYTGDQFLLKNSGTYYLFSSTSNVYHIYTSNSLASGYTDQGAITGWVASEGIGVFLDSTGAYWAYSNPRTGGNTGILVYSKSTTLAIGSWSSMTAVATSPYSDSAVQSIDNGAGFCFIDSDTLRDVLSAQNQQQFFRPSQPDSAASYLFPFPLNLNVVATTVSKTGTGTVSTSNRYQVTGTGTLFTHELQVGSMITSGAQYGYVTSISSDTTCTIKGFSPSGSFTYTDPPFASGNGFSDNTSTGCTYQSGGGTGSAQGNGSFVFGRGFDIVNGTDSANLGDPFTFSSSGGNLSITCFFPGVNTTGETPFVLNGTGLTVTNLFGKGSAPAIAAGTGAGTSPTVSIVGNNLCGEITVTTGTLPSISSTVATITRADFLPYPTHSEPILMPENANAAALSGTSMIFIPQSSTTAWTISSGTVALAPATTYIWHYVAVGY